MPGPMCFLYQCGAFQNPFSLSLSLSPPWWWSTATILPFDHLNLPPGHYFATALETSQLQFRNASFPRWFMSSPWKPNGHDLYASVPFDTRVSRKKHMYIYINIYTYMGVIFPPTKKGWVYIYIHLSKLYKLYKNMWIWKVYISV